MIWFPGSTEYSAEVKLDDEKEEVIASPDFVRMLFNRTTLNNLTNRQITYYFLCAKAELAIINNDIPSAYKAFTQAIAAYSQDTYAYSKAKSLLHEFGNTQLSEIVQSVTTEISDLEELMKQSQEMENPKNMLPFNLE